MRNLRVSRAGTLSPIEAPKLPTSREEWDLRVETSLRVIPEVGADAEDPAYERRSIEERRNRAIARRAHLCRVTLRTKALLINLVLAIDAAAEGHEGRRFGSANSGLMGTVSICIAESPQDTTRLSKSRQGALQSAPAVLRYDVGPGEIDVMNAGRVGLKTGSGRRETGMGSCGPRWRQRWKPSGLSAGEKR